MFPRVILTAFTILAITGGSLGGQSDQAPGEQQSSVQSASASNSANSNSRTDRIGSAMDRYAATEETAAEAPGGLGTFVETMLILGLFVLGIYGVFRFIQKKRGTTASGVENIRILSSLSLGGSKMLQLVEVGDQIFFIGVADNSINLISEIEDKETIDWIRMSFSKGESAGQEGFVEKLFSLLGREGTDTAARTENKVDFLQKQKERLSRLEDKEK